MLLKRLFGTPDPPAPFQLGDTGIEIVPRVNPRARRVSLKVDAAARRIELVMPPRASFKAARAFAEGQEGWIRARLAALPARVPFADGAVIPFCGSDLTVRHRPEARGAAWIEGTELLVAGTPPHMARRVRDFLIAEARRAMGDKARVLAARVERKVACITIRDTRTRWGSCSPDGRLAFSWRLIMAPPEVIDYIVAHEVAHLVHLHHGPQFWRLVEELMPGARQWRRWLTRHGNGLLRYG